MMVPDWQRSRLRGRPIIFVAGSAEAGWEGNAMYEDRKKRIVEVRVPYSGRLGLRLSKTGRA